jgi:hypothetical protein
MESQEKTSQIRTRKRTSIHPSAKSKKDIKAWIRGDLIKLENRDDGWEYRWCNRNDPVKMAQREAQGFVRVTSTSGLHAENAGQADIRHSSPSTEGIVEMGDLVLMALPEDLAEMRRQAVVEVNNEALQGMTEELDSNLGKVGAQKHGKLTIEVN